MSRTTVGRIVQKLGLPALKDRQPVEPVTPVLEPLQSTRNDKTTTIKEIIQPVIVAPVIVAEVQYVKNMVATFAIPPRTLKEIQKQQQLQDMEIAERKWKIANRESGFTQLLDQEINPIMQW